MQSVLQLTLKFGSLRLPCLDHFLSDILYFGHLTGGSKVSLFYTTLPFSIQIVLIGNSANFYLNNNFQWFWKRSGKFLPQLTLSQTMPQLYSLSQPNASWRYYNFFTYKLFWELRHKISNWEHGFWKHIFPLNLNHVPLNVPSTFKP